MAWILPLRMKCHVISRWRRAFFFVCGRASRIIVISQALKQQFVQADLMVRAFWVAPSGVDLEMFSLHIAKADARHTLQLETIDRSRCMQVISRLSRRQRHRGYHPCAAEGFFPRIVHRAWRQ